MKPASRATPWPPPRSSLPGASFWGRRPSAFFTHGSQSAAVTATDGVVCPTSPSPANWLVGVSPRLWGSTREAFYFGLSHGFQMAGSSLPSRRHPKRLADSQRPCCHPVLVYGCTQFSCRIPSSSPTRAPFSPARASPGAWGGGRGVPRGQSSPVTPAARGTEAAGKGQYLSRVRGSRPLLVASLCRPVTGTRSGKAALGRFWLWLCFCLFAPGNPGRGGRWGLLATRQCAH